MATNNVSGGKSLTLVAPAGGVVSGVPVIVCKLVVVPVASAEAGELFAGMTGGEWNLPCTASLTAGTEVKWNSETSLLNTAAASATNVVCGKLTSDEADDQARCLLTN